MKNFFLILKITFCLACTVVGAGVVTARELTSFYSSDSYVIGLFFSAIFITLLYIFSVIKYSSFKDYTLLNPDKEKFYSYLLVFSNFLCFSAYLSQINSALSFSLFRPVILFALIAVVAVVATRGIGKVSKFTSFLTVVAVLCVFIVVINSECARRPVNIKFTMTPVFVGFLYSSFNAFNAQPVIKDLTEKYGNKRVALSSVLCGVIFFLFTYFLSRGLIEKFSKNPDVDVPFLLISGNVKFLAYTAILVSVFCSLVNSSYSLFKIFGRFGNLGRLSVIVSGYIFSTVGVKVIMDFFYPIIAVLGACYFFKSMRAVVFIRIKNRRKVDTKIKRKGEKLWLKKRKIRLKN